MPSEPPSLKRKAPECEDKLASLLLFRLLLHSSQETFTNAGTWLAVRMRKPEMKGI